MRHDGRGESDRSDEASPLGPPPGVPSGDPPTTLLLERAVSGSAEAQDALIRRMYDDLHRRARQLEQSCLNAAGLGATEIMSEAYLRIFRSPPAWKDRRAFFTYAAKAMMSACVSVARAQRAQKRNGGRQRVPLDPDRLVCEAEPWMFERLDRALPRLREAFPTAAEVVELRVVGGLTWQAITELLGVSLHTARVEFDWGCVELRRILETVE